MPSGNGLPRSYVPSTDITAGQVNYRLLKKQIDDDAGLPALRTPANEGWIEASVADDFLKIWFAAALTGAEETTLDALVLAHTGAVTTRKWKKWESNASQATSGDHEAWKNAIVKTAPALAAGGYRVQWNFELRLVAAASSGAPDSLAAARFNYAGGAPEGVYCHAHTKWCGFSGWDFVNNVNEGDTPELKIQFRRNPGGNDTVQIRRVKMSIEWMGE